MAVRVREMIIKVFVFNLILFVQHLVVPLPCGTVPTELTLTQ